MIAVHHIILHGGPGFLPLHDDCPSLLLFLQYVSFGHHIFITIERWCTFISGARSLQMSYEHVLWASQINHCPLPNLVSLSQGFSIKADIPRSYWPTSLRADTDLCLCFCPPALNKHTQALIKGGGKKIKSRVSQEKWLNIMKGSQILSGP